MKYKTHFRIIITSLILLTALLNPFEISFISFFSFGWGINWCAVNNYDLALVLSLETVILSFIYLMYDVVNLFLLNNPDMNLIGIQEIE